jgi:hypothetical protein
MVIAEEALRLVPPTISYCGRGICPIILIHRGVGLLNNPERRRFEGRTAKISANVNVVQTGDSVEAEVSIPVHIFAVYPVN